MEGGGGGGGGGVFFLFFLGGVGRLFPLFLWPAIAFQSLVLLFCTFIFFRCLVYFAGS